MEKTLIYGIRNNHSGPKRQLVSVRPLLCCAAVQSSVRYIALTRVEKETLSGVEGIVVHMGSLFRVNS